MSDALWLEHSKNLKEAIRNWHTQYDWVHDGFDYLSLLSDYSCEQLNSFSECVTDLTREFRDVAIFACGSFGRLEGWKKSDVDLLMIVNPKAEEPNLEERRRYCETLIKVCDRLLERNNEAFDQSKLTLLRQVDAEKYLLKDVNSDVFRRWITINSLTSQPFDESDSLTRQVRRISLLFESFPLTNNAFTKSIKKQILENVYSIEDNSYISSESSQCLSRDTLRFVHSSHLFHEHKTSMGKASEPRYQKLIITRKLLGSATILMLRHFQANQLQIDWLCAPPIFKIIHIVKDRLASRLHTEWPAGLRLLSIYGSALHNIHLLPTQPIEQVQRGGRTTQVRSDIGGLAVQMNELIARVLEEALTRRGSKLSDLIGDLI